MKKEELLDLAEEKMCLAYEARTDKDRQWLMGMASAYLDVYGMMRREEIWKTNTNN